MYNFAHCLIIKLFKFTIFAISINIARNVKIADLQDNMNLSRFKDDLTQKDIERWNKYRKSLMFLRNEKEDTIY